MNMKNKVLLIIGALFITYFVFICEESIRLKSDSESLPLIVTDKTKCGANDYECYDNGEYKETYYSFGFLLKKDYYLNQDSNEENVKYHVVAEEFWLFNKFLIWAWIS